MSKQPPDLTALSHSTDSIGKLFSDSKTRHTWTFDVEGETQVVVVIASWNSSKFVVEVNGYERFHQVVSGVFVYSFKFRERYFKITARGEEFIFLIDAIPFDAYTAKSKATQAALLKSYESRPKPVPLLVPRVPSPLSEEEMPFSGDLGKRLGKKPEDYIAQEDEDIFAGVEVQSFVTTTANLTVIPDLLGLYEPAVDSNPPRMSIQELPESNEDAPTLPAEPVDDSTPPVGQVDASPVTPRDQIPLSDLANPFFAVSNPFI